MTRPLDHSFSKARPFFLSYFFPLILRSKIFEKSFITFAFLKAKMFGKRI